MIELSIRFSSDEKGEDSRINVSLFRPDTGVSTPPQPFVSPLDDGVLADIHWYLETFASWPTGPDYDRAERIESQLERWGQLLLDSALADKEAARLWQQFVDAADDRLLTIDAVDPRVLRLPWELLADEGGHLFSQEIGVRRRLRQTTAKKRPSLPLPVRILVVVARPDDADFIDSRAITRPLLDAVDGLGEQVVVEFLPQPTLKALSQRLRDRSAPPVHVVHFDGHGVYDQSLGLGFLLFENEKHERDQVDANRLGTLLNQTGVPLMVLNACQSGKQEDNNPYASVAARLIRSGIGSVLAMNYSVLVVAAHKFVAAFYAALAAGRSVGQAVDAGRFALYADVERHSIVRPNTQGENVEETIRLYDWFLPALYQQSADPVIFTAPENGAALEEMAAQPIVPTRQTYPALVRLVQTLFNKDELRALSYELGVQYDDLPGDGNAAKALSLVELAERRQALDALVEAFRKARPLANLESALIPSAAAEALASIGKPANPQAPSTASQPPAALPPRPRHGFHGRSREMLLLERAFRVSPVVVLHGFGGLGKTTLAAEAGRWFSRIGRFPGGAAFVSFEQGGSLEQLCSWVGQTVSGDPDWLVRGEGELVSRVGKLLAEKPALLILDNFESVLGREPLMPAEEVAAVLAAVWQWSAGQFAKAPNSVVLITTRDTSFNDGRFAPSEQCRHVGLQGLATPDALALAAALLDHHAIDREGIARDELVALMRHLGGHPLSLNLVLPHLRQHRAQQLIEQFETLLPGFVQGKAEERNESLAVSLDFSLRRLGEETRAALPALGLFAGLCNENELLAISEIDEELWRVARGDLEQAALLRIESLPGIKPPFLHFHPTLLPYLLTQLDDERRATLQTKYWRRYYGLAIYLYKTDTQNPHMARAIVVRELPNLHRALELALAAAQGEPALLEQVVTFSTCIAKFLDDFGRWRERDEMMARVGEQFSAAGQPLAGDGGGERKMAEQGAITKAEYLLKSRQGETLLQQGRAAPAEALFQQLLARLQAEAAYDDAAYDIAVTQLRLGRCLAAQGRPSEAISFHQQARDGFAALSEGNKSAKKMLGEIYNELADNLAAIGQLTEAQSHYETALEIKREVDDQRAVGVTFGQLGTLAMKRGDREMAQKRYGEALATFQRLGEPQSEAVIWHQLGMVAQGGRDWVEAERCYKEAVRLSEQMQDWTGVAQGCNQLAIVAGKDGRLADAERWYLRAIELGEQLGDGRGLATRLGNLANLYLSQQRLIEAEQYALRALAIMETLDLSAKPWKTYGILAQIATAQGNSAAARDWRRKEQESFAAYAGAAHQLPSWAPNFIRAVVDAVKGNAEAKEAVAKLLPQLAETNDWRNLPPVVEQVLHGEMNLESLTDNLDHIDAYIIRLILQQLAGDGSSTIHPSEGSPSTAGPSAGQPAEAAPADPLTRLRQTWGPVVVGVVAAAQGEAAAAAQLEPLLAQLAQQADWRALAGVLRRLLSGERSLSLLEGLDQTDTLIVGNILRGLGVEGEALASLPSLVAAAPQEEAAGATQAEAANDFFDSLLSGVVAVARGESAPQLSVQLHAVTRGLASDDTLQPEMRVLGRVLNDILSGERSPDLAGLSAGVAERVRGVLVRIGG